MAIPPTTPPTIAPTGVDCLVAIGIVEVGVVDAGVVEMGVVEVVVVKVVVAGVGLLIEVGVNKARMLEVDVLEVGTGVEVNAIEVDIIGGDEVSTAVEEGVSTLEETLEGIERALDITRQCGGLLLSTLFRVKDR